MIYNNQLKEYILSNSSEEILNILLPWRKEYWRAVSIKKHELRQEIRTLEKEFLKNNTRINELKELKSKLTDQAIKNIKNDISLHLFEEQKGRCYYCEGEFFKNRIGVGSPTIDHIADKATYPHYLYIPKNLVLSCHECNGFTKKGTKNVITPGCIKMKYDSLDSKDFIFVHPYLDIKEEHMKYNESTNVWSTINKSEKGEQSISIFQLNASYSVMGRYKQEYLNMSEEDNQLLEKVMSYTE